MSRRSALTRTRIVPAAIAALMSLAALAPSSIVSAKAAAPALPSTIVTYDGVQLDKNGIINPALLAAALESLKVHNASVSNQRRIAIADVGSDSRLLRFYVVNLTDGSVRPLVTTHGKGSDPDNLGHAQRVSNIPGSLATSTGAYVTAEHYYSDKHQSSAVRLDGLDPSNSNARCRCVVVHAANRKDGQNYASTEWLKRYGRAGRSDGCLAFAKEDFAYVLDRLSPGTFLFVGPVSLPSFTHGNGECLCAPKAG